MLAPIPAARAAAADVDNDEVVEKDAVTECVECTCTGFGGTQGCQSMENAAVDVTAAAAVVVVVAGLAVGWVEETEALVARVTLAPPLVLGLVLVLLDSLELV